MQASIQGTAVYQAIENLIKGVEVELPQGISFNDKDGHPRNAVRVQWWKDKAHRLGDIVLPVDLDIGDAANLPIPDSVPAYASDNPPCFIGHYRLTGIPEPLSSNVACVDYSVAKEGELVAYRWSGEQVLKTEKFICV